MWIATKYGWYALEKMEGKDTYVIRTRTEVHMVLLVKRFPSYKMNIRKALQTHSPSR